MAASESERGSAPEYLSIARRFENYEVMLDEDGKPIELGRGAMGITYKAFDVDLRIPVTLKVISERYLGDEIGAATFFTRSAGGSERSSPERSLRFPPRQNRSELLLCDGVCGGGDA
jgi:hypothetical protein